jgi:hypothetical protein
MVEALGCNAEKMYMFEQEAEEEAERELLLQE